MMMEELQEKLRQANIRLQKAQDEQKAKEKDIIDGADALKRLKNRMGFIQQEENDFFSSVTEKLNQFDGLRFKEIYSNWFQPNIVSRSGDWMGEISGAVSGAQGILRQLEEDEQRKKDTASRLAKEVEQIKREIEKAASAG